MEQTHYISSAVMNALLLQHAALQQMLIETQQQMLEMQQQIIEAQKKTISLQKKLEKKTPKTPQDESVFWHIASDGIMSTEAANSKDLETVRKFEEWNVKFAEKHIKPYVNSKVYGECLNQMTRGLPERIAALETQRELRFANNGHNKKVNITPIR